MRKLSLVLLALVLIPLVAHASNRQKRDGKASADGTVVISNVCGEVEVEGWDKPTVEVDAELEADDDEVTFETTGSRTTIAVVDPSGGDVDCAELEVKVPAGSVVEVHTVSAEVEVGGVTGALDLQTVSGSIDVSGSPSEVEIQTVSGDVTVPAVPKLEVESVSSKLVLGGSGNAELDAETVSGGVVVNGGPFRELEVETVSGDIEVEAILTPNARVKLVSHSGDIDLALPAGVSADFELESFSGRIRDELAGHEAVTPKYGPGSGLEFELGGGSARIRAETFSGNLTVKAK